MNRLIKVGTKNHDLRKELILAGNIRFVRLDRRRNKSEGKNNDFGMKTKRQPGVTLPSAERVLSACFVESRRTSIGFWSGSFFFITICELWRQHIFMHESPSLRHNLAAQFLVSNVGGILALRVEARGPKLAQEGETERGGTHQWKGSREWTQGQSLPARRRNTALTVPTSIRHRVMLSALGLQRNDNLSLLTASRQSPLWSRYGNQPGGGGG